MNAYLTPTLFGYSSDGSSYLSSVIRRRAMSLICFCCPASSTVAWMLFQLGCWAAVAICCWYWRELTKMQCQYSDILPCTEDLACRLSFACVHCNQWLFMIGFLSLMVVYFVHFFDHHSWGYHCCCCCWLL